MVEAPVARGAATKPAARGSGKANVTSVMPTHAPQAPDRWEELARLPSDKIGMLQSKLLIACSLLEMLVFNLDSEMKDGFRGSDDVMGVLQHTDLLLCGVNREIMAVDGVLPADLRGRTFEAKAIVAVAQRMTFDSGWHFEGYDSTMLIACFDAAGDCIRLALRALETVEVRNA